MELITFIISMSIGLIVTGFSLKSQSYVFGLFGGIMLVLLSMSVLAGGLQKQMIEITVNETGNYTTNTVETEMLEGDIMNNAIFSIPILGLGLYILINCALRWNDDRRGMRFRY